MSYLFHGISDVEGWHLRLKKALPHLHPNRYLLIQALSDEAALVTVNGRLVAQGKLDRQQRKCTTARDQKLAELWSSYESKDVATSEYLKECVQLTEIF
jgi:hypothetical protein